MLTDAQGLELRGATPEAAALYGQALDAFNVYRGDPVALVDGAIVASPDFAMAHLLKAYLFGLSTEPEATRAARDGLAYVRTLSLSEREASHLKALDAIVSGAWTAAAAQLDRHNVLYPRDLLGIQAGHLVDFYRAGARSLRDRIARVLPKWSADTPGYSLLLGMHAFGLEETGDYVRAEDAGRRALAADPRDAWAHHAVAHVMEVQGRAQDGIGWMADREPHWSGDDNFFRVHNWWHRALFHLDLGQHAEVLELYDGPIRGGRSMVALDMVDASALLWRLHLCGVDVGTRWDELATAWDAHADGSTYPFNDWHAVMAYLGAGRDADAARLIATCRAVAADAVEATRWGGTTALPLIEGFTAFWRGDHATAAERLAAARSIANSFGGSHAQRDIIDWTLAESAIRGGFADLGEALAAERLALKPHSPINQGFLTRAAATRPAT